MLIKEYRICMPMTVEEYRIAQLYMIQKKSREESTGNESGVEILKNEPYTDGPGGNGQYTFKIYHVGSHLPGWLRSIIPETALRVEEEAWNAYPYTRTRYKVPFIEKFNLEIETMYLDDAGDSDNVFNMSPADLSNRIVDFIDIVTDPLTPPKACEDPRTYVSAVTGRGPLGAEWRSEFAEAMREGRRYPKVGLKPDASGALLTEPLPLRIMCSYKVCRVEFRYWGMQSKIESFIQDIALRRTMVGAHRQAWTWQDEWYGLTMTEIRRLEVETAKALAVKMGRSVDPDAPTPSSPQATPTAAGAATGPANQWGSSVTSRGADDKKGEEELAAPPINFGSCMSFASESEGASMFQSLHGSDGEEDFFDAQSVNTNGDMASDAHLQGLHYAGSGEAAQSSVLLFVVHGGCLQEKAVDDSSRYADFTTFKTLLESTVTNYFPGLQSRVNLRLISAPSLAADSLRTLNMLDPAVLEPGISGANRGAMRSIIPIGNIPLLLTSSPHYPQDIQRLAQQMDESYVNFRDSKEGANFSGSVCVVADSIGSIMLYDLLASSSSTFKHEDTITNLESFPQDLSDGPSLIFDIQDVFLLGSPLGLLLFLRHRIGGGDFVPSRPFCDQVFNIFNVADPFAYRLEPLLDASYAQVPVVHLPSASGAHSQPQHMQQQWQRLRLHLALAQLPLGSSGSNGGDSPLAQIPSVNSEIPSRSSISEKTSQDFTQGRESWWGQQRMDVGLHCSEAVQNILSRALPPLVHSSYWESRDASCFIVWQLSERLYGRTSDASHALLFDRFDFQEAVGPAAATVDNSASRVSSRRIGSGGDFGRSSLRTHNSSPSMTSGGGIGCGGGSTSVGGLTRQFRNSISNRLRFRSKPAERSKASCLPYSMGTNPNHRANDAIVLEGQPQVITARFTFGSLDLSSLANEEVEIFYRSHSILSSNAAAAAGGWERLGSQRTDGNGRLTFQLPESARLPLGLHRIQLVPRSSGGGIEPDDQAVQLTLAVVPPGCSVVICSIDGSFAASLSLMGKLYRQPDPKVRAGSVEIMRHWHALGYLLVYVSARPDMQHRQVAAWLQQHGFPPGLTFFLDGLCTDPLRQKASLLRSLVEQNQLAVHCAYGSVKDISIYRTMGLSSHQIFAVGKLSRRQAAEATPIREGYASHFKELMDQRHLSTPAAGPMSSVVLREDAEFRSSLAKYTTSSPAQPTVFFDLPGPASELTTGSRTSPLPQRW